MKTLKRLQGYFTWTQNLVKNADKKPLFWLTRDGEDLYFANDSDEILDVVKSTTGGFSTIPS